MIKMHLFPVDKFVRPNRYFSVITDTGLKSAAQFNELIIRDNQNQAVRLKTLVKRNWILKIRIPFFVSMENRVLP